MTGGGQTGELVPQDVILREAGANPAAVAEAVRAMTGLEAAAAAELVARAPSAIRTRIAPALAEALRVKLQAVGATVELRTHGAAPAPAFFDVYLRDRGDNKINVVRALKMMMGLGLREAVELVDDAPCLLKRRLAQDEAEALRHELVEAGAIVEVHAHDGSAPAEREVSGASAAMSWGATSSGAAPTVVTGSAAPASTPADGFAVVLHHFGTRKIDVVKLVREATGLGLKEAKDLSESIDVVIKQGLDEPEARALERALAAVGAQVSVRGAPRAAPTATPQFAAGSRFDVVLRHHGPNKISVIKVIREHTTLGLKDAKDLSEAADSVIKQGVGEDEARTLQQALMAVGGQVELRAVAEPPPPDLPEPSRGFGVILRYHGENKISVIKLIREATGLGLKDAKDLSESTDVMVKEGLRGDEARALAEALTAVGARVEIRGQALDEDEDDDLTPIDVVLNDCGSQKIMVIKLIREVTGLGLKEAKDLSETPGAVVREGLRRGEASALAQQLVAFGAAVELREPERRRESAEVDLFLQVCGPNKISVIKEVRAITGLGLKEAKDLVEAAPTLIRAGVDRETARQQQALLAQAGATVELR